MHKTKPRFSNRLYQADLGRTEARSPIIKIVPMNSKGPSAHYRQVNAFIYDLASKLAACWRSYPTDATHRPSCHSSRSTHRNIGS